MYTKSRKLGSFGDKSYSPHISINNYNNGILLYIIITYVISAFLIFRKVFFP
jgi:hypothetical protein